jgi:hypothetical protein
VTQDPPNLLSEDETPPALPQRPVAEVVERAPPPQVQSAPEPEAISDFWTTDDIQQQRALEQEQQRLKEQMEAELLQQQMMAMQQQREFDERQRLQAEQQRLAEEQLLRDQFHRQAQGHAAELERQLLELKGQQNNNLLLLESYDNVRCVRNMLMYLRANLELESESFGK